MYILYLKWGAIMSISEFKDSVNLIISFVARVNEEAIPFDIKKTMVKVYANTLRINLSDRMVDSIFRTTNTSLSIESLSQMAQS
jgi:hypothetical protein